MIKPKIIVTGATGKTGSVVVTELLKAGYPVRAMVHREDGRSARLKAQGAEICGRRHERCRASGRCAEGRSARLFLSAFRSVHDSGRGCIRHRRAGIAARTHRRPDPMAVEPLPSVAL